MEPTIYDTPKSELGNTATKTLSMSEKLAQSRRDMEEASAIEKLNLVWGVRLALDLLLCVLSLYGIYQSLAKGSYEAVGINAIVVGFFGAEIIAIVGYFRRKPWCVIPLHIFSGISILNMPFGTILSIVHYLNMSKIRFNDNV